MNKQHKLHVWDLPLRLFHWLLVATFAGLWFTGKELEMDWHIPLGFVMLGLLIFRLLWGITGSHHARFVNFPLHPRSLKQYLTTKTFHTGHNPMGSWSVVALLSLLMVQVVSGLFAGDGYLYEGPLSRFIDSGLVDWITDIHRASFDILLGFIGLHVAAVAYYVVIKRQDILHAMVSGKRSVPEPMQPFHKASWKQALSCIVTAALVAAGIGYGVPLM
ncbi:cytochrome b/b6 domain-containing protein [Endozoicomonadaceae bacterium StTr2]